MGNTMTTTAAIAFAATLFLPIAGGSFAADLLPAEVKAKVSGELVWHDGSGGATTRAREETVIKAFKEETGIGVKGDFNSDMTKFFAAMDSGASIPWSMIEFPTKGDFIKARDAGYLQKLDSAVVDLKKVGRTLTTSTVSTFCAMGLFSLTIPKSLRAAMRQAASWICMI